MLIFWEWLWTTIRSLTVLIKNWLFPSNIWFSFWFVEWFFEWETDGLWSFTVLDFGLLKSPQHHCLNFRLLWCWGEYQPVCLQHFVFAFLLSAFLNFICLESIWPCESIDSLIFELLMIDFWFCNSWWIKCFLFWFSTWFSFDPSISHSSSEILIVNSVMTSPQHFWWYSSLDFLVTKTSSTQLNWVSSF